MNIILQQVYIIATVCLLICRTGIIRWIKWRLFGPAIDWAANRIKPFDCPLCMTFWVSLFVDGYSLSIPEAVGIASVNALIASELEKYLRK